MQTYFIHCLTCPKQELEAADFSYVVCALLLFKTCTGFFINNLHFFTSFTAAEKSLISLVLQPLEHYWLKLKLN